MTTLFKILVLFGILVLAYCEVKACDDEQAFIDSINEECSYDWFLCVDWSDVNKEIKRDKTR